MRLTALAAAIACLGLSLITPAAAADLDRDHRPAGWGRERVVHHWVYRPRYTHVYHVDPYAYQYRPRGYYPYYGSRYWASASVIRKRNRLHYNVWNTQPPRFRYYQSWGYPKRWNHAKWHREHHGYHRRWHY